MSMSQSFEKYLRVTRDGDDGIWAKRHGLRADDFDETMVGKVVARTLQEMAKQKLTNGATASGT
jgi:hypothetical protein